MTNKSAVRCPKFVSDTAGDHCKLTGASMLEADCTVEASQSCLPGLSLRYAQGERQILASLDQATREAVIATAKIIRERGVAANLPAETIPQPLDLSDPYALADSLSPERSITDDERQLIRKLRKEGVTFKEIARRLNRSLSTLQRALK
jgi:DNA-binding NarL/FixJ family response regulator